MTGDAASSDAFARLARPSGTLALVALDQRESLRAMLLAAGRAARDADLSSFKVTAARILSPHASGLLLDREFGFAPVLDAGALAPDCGLIVAVDRLRHGPGGVVVDTDLDEAMDPAALAAAGAVALKLLLLWRPDRDRERRLDVAGRFVDACRRAGVLSLLEAVARLGAEPSPAAHADAVVEAAIELAPAGAGIYKAEVPGLTRADESVTIAASRRVTAAVPGPWVVLSAGVPPDRFAEGVEGATRGGASGFLAGRAIWSPAILGAEALRPALEADAVARLDRLVAIADASGRPWTQAVDGTPFVGAGGAA